MELPGLPIHPVHKLGILMKFFRCSLVMTIVLLQLLTTSVLAAPGIPYSLDSLIEIALKNNPQIEIALQQYQQSEGGITQAKSGYLPHLTVGADYGRLYTDNLQPVDEDNFAHGLISASQLIYDFGRTTGLIDASIYSSVAADSNLLQKIQNIVFQVKANYYSVLEKEQLIDVAQQAVDTYVQQLYRAKKYFEAGVRTKIDVTNASVELANARLDLLRANSNLKAARVKLEQILGTIPDNGNYTVEQKVKGLEQLAPTKPPMPLNLDGLLDTASLFRPELKRVHSLVQATEASLTQVKGDYFPSILASGSYDAYETDLTNLQDQWTLAVGLTWEIFSGFETEGKVAEAKSKMRELQASLRELELAIIQDVTDSYLRADENREAVDIEAQTLKLARENLDLAEGRYKAGLNDIIEFNDAQLTYSRSQSNLVSAYYTYLTALARIEYSTGVIADTEGKPIDKSTASE